MVANSTFLWPYNWPLDWPFWCNLLTEGVVSYEELGNAKKALSKKCASSVHPKNATESFLALSVMPRGGLHLVYMVATIFHYSVYPHGYLIF